MQHDKCFNWGFFDSPPFRLTGPCRASVVIISVGGLFFTSIHHTIFSFHLFAEVQNRNQNRVPNMKEASVKQKTLKLGIIINISFPSDYCRTRVAGIKLCRPREKHPIHCNRILPCVQSEKAEEYPCPIN